MAGKIPKEVERREVWLKELSEFIVEANQNTWAADGAEVEPERKGYEELEYKKGDWRLRDSFTGYFRAPGMTTVYYKDTPVWTMAYGGTGMTRGNEHLAKQSFKFLKQALTKVSSDMPYRGPNHKEGNWEYIFELKDGDISDFLWREEIFKGEEMVFTQTGIGGLIIHRNEDKEPDMPWNL